LNKDLDFLAPILIAGFILNFFSFILAFFGQYLCQYG